MKKKAPVMPKKLALGLLAAGFRKCPVGYTRDLPALKGPVLTLPIVVQVSKPQNDELGRAPYFQTGVSVCMQEGVYHAKYWPLDTELAPLLAHLNALKL
jgi:hypothetical protein